MSNPYPGEVVCMPCRMGAHLDCDSNGGGCDCEHENNLKKSIDK